LKIRARLDEDGARVQRGEREGLDGGVRLEGEALGEKTHPAEMAACDKESGWK
jgi:hypothetical protein